MMEFICQATTGSRTRGAVGAGGLLALNPWAMTSPTPAAERNQQSAQARGAVSAKTSLPLPSTIRVMKCGVTLKPPLAKTA